MPHFQLITWNMKKSLWLLDSVSQLYKRWVFHHDLSCQVECSPCSFRMLTYTDKLPRPDRHLFPLIQTQLDFSFPPTHFKGSHFTAIFWRIRTHESPPFSPKFQCPELTRASLCPDICKQYWLTGSLIKDSKYLHYMKKFRLRIYLMGGWQWVPHMQNKRLERVNSFIHQTFVERPPCDTL